MSELFTRRRISKGTSIFSGTSGSGGTCLNKPRDCICYDELPPEVKEADKNGGGVGYTCKCQKIITTTL